MNIKKLILVIFLSIHISSSYAQSSQTEPIDASWIQLLEMRNISGNSNDSTGGMPSPTKYHFIYPVGNIQNGTRSLPAIYDLRTAGSGGTSLLNPVRNQGTCGSCWTFGAYGSMESWLKKSGQGIFNFSENNMKECHGFDYASCYGGNLDMVTAYLARRDGPINDANDPYVDGNVTCTEGLNEQLYITDVRFLPDIMDTIKQAIMDHGAIYTTMYWQNSPTYYNSSNYTYYFSGGYDYNHIVMLVGWNDSKVTSGGTGAWIIQNSWGTSWGESGFFYVSYNDTRINTSVGYFEKKKNVTNDLYTLYQNDKLGATGGYGYSDSICYGMVKFVSENNFDIKSISTYAKSSNTKIEISIYDQFSNGALSGLLATIPQQVCTHPGYYTFDLPSPIVVPQGDDFYVRIKYVAPATTWPAPIEMYMSGYASPEISRTSYCSHNGADNTWYKLNEYDLAIKVYSLANVSAIASSLVSPSCYQAADGAISLQTWGGQPPYSYTWNTIPAQHNSSITNLNGGTYSCTVTDALSHFTVYSFTLNEPDSIRDYTLVHNNSTCYGASDGAIEIFAENTTYSEQYASTVISVTSSMGGWPATNMTGAPDGLSWNSNYSLDRQILVLGYNTPRKISGVTVYEKLSSGSIDSIYVRKAVDGTWHNVYAGNTYFLEQDSAFHVSFPRTAFDVDAVKLSSYGDQALIYPLIDAVSICIPDECSYSWNSGQNTAAIGNLPAGAYTVTMTNTDGCHKHKTFFITQPDSLMVKAMNDTSICSGNPVNLQAQATAPLTWYTDGNPTPLTGTLVYPNTSIAYVAKAQTACGTVYDTVNIQVETTPYLDAVSDTSICNGNSVNLQATGFGLIQWYQAADTVPLSNLTVTPTASTSYIVTASNADCPMALETMHIVVNYIPDNAGTITGDSTICQGQNAVEYLIPSIDYATSYLWSLPTGASGTSSTNSILVDFSASAATGTISVAGTNVCGQGQTSNLLLNIYSIPPTPVITIDGNMLHSSAPAGNQWYIQGLQIMDGDGQDYQATTDGDYYVIVTLNGCSSSHSNVITTNFAGIQTVTDNMGLYVFPNPVEAEMIIEIKGNTDDIDFEIFNSLGEIIFKGVLQGKTTIPTASFAQGIYLLRLKTGQEIKFIKTAKD